MSTEGIQELLKLAFNSGSYLTKKEKIYQKILLCLFMYQPTVEAISNIWTVEYSEF